MGRLEGKVLLVCGGGADGPPKPGETVPMGNGRATAILGAREGATVMVVDRALDAAAKTAELIRSEGGRAEAFAADVRDEESCRAAVAATVKTLGALHLLVNIVGIATGHTLESPTAEFDTTMEVNVRGHLLMMRYAIPGDDQGGRRRDRQPLVDLGKPRRRGCLCNQQGRPGRAVSRRRDGAR